MPSHPDRVRRAYTPQTPARWQSGFDLVTGDFVTTVRIATEDLDAYPTERERLEAFRRLRQRIAAEMER